MLRPSITTAALIALCSPAFGWQPLFCPTEPWELVVPAGLSAGDQYGASMTTAGDWLFVGAPLDDQLASDAGAVYVFQIDDGVYEFRQKLIASGGMGAAHFGAALAAHGDRLIVGADFDQQVTQADPNAWGAAYIFRLVDNLWIHEQKLLAFGDGSVRQHGNAVALQDNLAAVGARFVLNDGVNGMGAAFIYRFNGTNWIDEQRLTSDAPSAFDHFGLALAVSGDSLLVGSPHNDDVATNAGAVYVFRHDGALWMQQSKLYAFDAAAGDQFGARLAAAGNTLMVAAPLHDGAGQNSGACYEYIESGQVWVAGAKITAADAAAGEAFASSIALSGDDLVAGAPEAAASLGGETYSQAGAAYVYKRINGRWIQVRRLQPDQGNYFGYGRLACWSSSPQPPEWPQPMTGVRFGLSACMSPLGHLGGSALARPPCWDFSGSESAGAVTFFPFPEDCNLNWFADDCEAPDCNGNYEPDECEIVSMTSTDCNNNSVPDECDIGFTYQLNEIGKQSIYWFVNSATGNADFIWLNQYRVKPGGQVISHVALESTPFLPFDMPIQVMIYNDPNGDGKPFDAQLLAVADSKAVSYGDLNNVRMVYVPIPATYVGEPGTIFFVGAVIHALYLNNAEYPWAVPATAEGSHPYRRSWRAFAPPGQANVQDLMSNASPVQLWTNPPFILHAVASDCNGNGAWDACEIANGEVPDVNGNGIPDSCEVPACFFADLAPASGDGQVNLLDLLHVVNNWGVCNPCYAICPGDTNDDCATNVIDLLAVINGWGPCP